MPTINLTKRSIEALPLTTAGQVLYRDTELKGFGLRVGSTSKVFFVEGQVRRRTVRSTIGKFGPLSPDVARRLALQQLAEMSQGRDPNAERRREEAESLSLRAAFESFFAAKPNLSRGTKSNYQRTLNLYLADWAAQPLRDISRQAILLRHRRISDEHGPVTANYAMRHLRSVYNFVAATHEEYPSNPVAILTQARTWAPERRRRRLVPAHDLFAWWAAVMQEQPLARDFLLVALFTGMRRREIAGLRWENVDLRGRTLTVPKTKNGEPLTLPLSSFLTRLLMERRLLVGGSPYVFPTRSATGHVAEVKSFTRRVGERCGVEFSAHDLRRTFITIAESLDIPAYALKRLLNHRASADVTGGYIVIDVERLREPVEKIAQQILESTSGGENSRLAACK
jgi:integrase